jgi:hypothetical protein
MPSAALIGSLLTVVAVGVALMALGVGTGVAMVGLGTLGVMFAGLGTAPTPSPAVLEPDAG